MGFELLLNSSDRILNNDPKKANVSIGLLTFLCSLLAVSFIAASLYINIRDLNGENFECFCSGKLFIYQKIINITIRVKN